MRKLIVTFVGIALSGLAVSAQEAGDAAKGQIAYGERKCATCHRLNPEDQKGGKMSTVLSEAVAKLSAADIKTWLTDAPKMEAKLPKMPVVKMSSFLKGLKPPLSAEEVANLVAYVRTLPVKP